MILVLEKIDLKQSLKKDAYNEKMSYFETRLGELQRACRAAGIPVIILFEGWRGSQRSVIINHMMQQMDARGFRVYSASKMADEEPDQPFFEPFWRQLPAKGNMAVYYRSWYYLKNEYTFDRDADQVKRINTSYRHINAFEKQLTDDNYVLLKFFVHVSEKQLKANVQKAEKTYGKGWNKVSESDDDFVDYQRYLEIYEKMFIDSDRPNAHWYLIAGDDTRFPYTTLFRSYSGWNWRWPKRKPADRKPGSSWCYRVPRSTTFYQRSICPKKSQKRNIKRNWINTSPN